MTMQIPQDRLDAVLSLYKPDCRYLISAVTEFPKAAGEFRLHDTYYTSARLEHITAVEAQLCLNQLCYSAFGEWWVGGRFEETSTFDEYLMLMKENMFIIDTNIRFKKPIPTNGVVNGSIELVKIKRLGNLYLAFIDYDLEFGKSLGKIELALKRG